MKKSYHSIVVPIVDAMTALRSCALCSDPDIVSYVVALAIGVLLRPLPALGDRLRCLPYGKQFRGNAIPSNPCHGRPRFSGGVGRLYCAGGLRSKNPLAAGDFASVAAKPVSARARANR